MRYITRFTEEVFAILISLIFIFEVIHKLQEVRIDLQNRDQTCFSMHQHMLNPKGSVETRA